MNLGPDVQRHQEIDHPVGVVDGLAVERALLAGQEVALLLRADGRGDSQLFGRDLQRRGLLVVAVDEGPVAEQHVLVVPRTRRTEHDAVVQPGQAVLARQVQALYVLLHVQVERVLPELLVLPDRVLLRSFERLLLFIRDFVIRCEKIVVY